MARKSKKLIEEEIKAAERLKEVSKLKEEFCGVILTSQDLAAIVKLAFETKDTTIKIPARFYFNDI